MPGIDSRKSRVHLPKAGITLHCVDAGPLTGPLVILLHGFPEFWWGWRRQIAPLVQAGFRVVAPDQRGYNLSDKPKGLDAYRLDLLADDIAELAAVFGRDKVSLVGHDWGGVVAWWTATRHPDLVERLVAINAPHPRAMRDFMRRHPRQVLKSLYMAFFRIPWLPEAMLSARHFRALKEKLVAVTKPGTFTEADLSRYEEAWSHPGALTGMLNWYRANAFKRFRARQSNVAMPVLILWGMQDPFIDGGVADASLRICDQGQLQRFSTAGHWVHLEETDRVNAALVDFLSGRSAT